MKEGIFKQLVSVVRYLANLERTTTAGRINILGMLLSLILAISLSLAPLFETLVRLFRPGVDVGAPLIQIFAMFCVFTLICSSMIAYMERSGENKPNQPAAKDHVEKSDERPDKPRS